MKLRATLLSAALLVVASCGTTAADLAESEESAGDAAPVSGEVETDVDRDHNDPMESAGTDDAVPRATIPSAPGSDDAGEEPAGGGEETLPDRSDVEKQPEAVEEHDGADRIVGEVPHGMLLLVLEDAAAHAGVGTDALLVARAEAIEWPDGSLGCPEPGIAYTQAVVPGYWVELVSGEDRYDYRLSADGYFMLCTGAGRPIGSPDA